MVAAVLGALAREGRRHLADRVDAGDGENGTQRREAEEQVHRVDALESCTEGISPLWQMRRV